MEILIVIILPSCQGGDKRGGLFSALNDPSALRAPPLGRGGG